MKYEIRGTKYGIELYKVQSTKNKVGTRIVQCTRYQVRRREKNTKYGNKTNVEC